jgi:hypothetical protein
MIAGYYFVPGILVRDWILRESTHLPPQFSAEAAAPNRVVSVAALGWPLRTPQPQALSGKARRPDDWRHRWRLSGRGAGKGF